MNINFFNLHPKKSIKESLLRVWFGFYLKEMLSHAWLYGFYDNNDNIDIYGGMIKKNNFTPDFKEFKIPKTLFGLSL